MREGSPLIIPLLLLSVVRFVTARGSDGSVKIDLPTLDQIHDSFLDDDDNYQESSSDLPPLTADDDDDDRIIDPTRRLPLTANRNNNRVISRSAAVSENNYQPFGKLMSWWESSKSYWKSNNLPIIEMAWERRFILKYRHTFKLPVHTTFGADYDCKVGIFQFSVSAIEPVLQGKMALTRSEIGWSNTLTYSKELKGSMQSLLTKVQASLDFRTYKFSMKVKSEIDTLEFRDGINFLPEIPIPAKFPGSITVTPHLKLQFTPLDVQFHTFKKPMLSGGRKKNLVGVSLDEVHIKWKTTSCLPRLPSVFGRSKKKLKNLIISPIMPSVDNDVGSSPSMQTQLPNPDPVEEERYSFGENVNGLNRSIHSKSPVIPSVDNDVGSPPSIQIQPPNLDPVEEETYRIENHTSV